VTVPRLPCLSVAIFLAGPWLPGPVTAADRPAPDRQQHGPARLVIEGGTVHDDKLDVPLAGVLRVILTVEGGRGLEVEPVKEITGAEGWGVRPAAAPEEAALSPDRVRWRQEFVLEPMKPVEEPLALAPLRYREAGGEWQTAAWDQIPVEITKEVSSADLKQLHDIRPPIKPPAPPPWPRWPLGVLGAVLLLGLAAGIWRLARRRQPAPPPLSPQDWALQELDRLDALDLPAQGEINLYHTLLSDTVRRYLELRFQLPASHQTTAEFLRAANGFEQLTTPHRELLRAFFERCDLAKFARAVPAPDECAAVAALARSFIAETGPPALASAVTSSA
jgi:hypothetical protein